MKNGKGCLVEMKRKIDDRLQEKKDGGGSARWREKNKKRENEEKTERKMR